MLFVKFLDAKLDRVWFLSVVNATRTYNVIYQSKNLDAMAQIYYLFTKYITIAPKIKLGLLRDSLSDLRYYHNGPFYYTENSEVLNLILTRINPFSEKYYEYYGLAYNKFKYL